MHIIQNTKDIQDRKEVLLRNINNKIDNYTESKNQKQQMFFYMCSLALLIMIPFSFFIFKEKPSEQEFVFSVPKGSISNVCLLDGTKVYLNGGSSLVLSSGFSKDNRTIQFDGEGFFDVQQDSKHPFIINTPKFNVQVVGTQFNLNSGNMGPNFSITMKEGTVKLTAKHEDFFTSLVKGQQFVYDSIAKEYNINNVNSNDLPSWHTGKLVFRNSTLYDITQQLERRFDVVIHIEDISLQEYAYFAEFKNGETLTQILNLLSYKDDWKFIIDANAVSIMKK